MKARIYKPSKSTMQSGRGKLEDWIVEYEPETAKEPEALMGWTAAGDTLGQIQVKFSTLKEAEKYAKEEGLDYTILQARERKVKPRNYGDNFKYVPPKKPQTKAKKAARPKTTKKKSS
ncbi:MAG: ETC complex I subunit [Pseudomonadota bacterium]